MPNIIKKIISALTKIGCLTFFTGSLLLADGFGPIPMSLKGAPVPNVPGLVGGSDPIIINKNKALILGKALFWDINVGSDGIACATCHFHAGADRRIKNQIAPAGKNSELPKEFELARDGTLRGPNAILKRNDFPFYQTDDPLSPTGSVIFNSDDVVSSSGTFGGDYRDVKSIATTNDQCNRSSDPVFHVGTKGTRKVEPRNTPTVINAVFNFRSFWDGRANNIFNGSSPWGDRDPDAGVWIRNGDGTVAKERLRLINSSLASLAISPPLDDSEMSCHGRTFADLGRKLLNRKPLEHQRVHWNDSVLGGLAHSTPNNLQKGLNTSYHQLIMEAFNPKYWDYIHTGPFGVPPLSSATHSTPYRQVEANFAMFFALALQIYQSTLISDDSPFDRSAVDEHGIPVNLSASAQRGMDIFRDSHCALCHIGPNFTSSAVVTNGILQKLNPHAFGNSTFRVSTTTVVTSLSLTGGMMFQDTGFSGTGVTPVENDIGLGGTDPFGNPLSFSDQYLQLLGGNVSGVVDPYVANVRPCDLDTSIAIESNNPHPLFFTRVDGIQRQKQNTVNCFNPAGIFIPTINAALTELSKPKRKRFLSAANGSFKIPTLRNIELTGPYMHNGGMATLDEVLAFYTRGGNFATPPKEFAKIFALVDLRLAPQKRTDLLNFLKSLTDDRVRYEKAPFDHPEIRVPHGHIGDNSSITKQNPMNASLAADQFLVIPAVGAAGRIQPLQSFDRFLQ
ncbi:cytochrome-c peroxidase [Nitrosomonas ureae]|uniref:Di-haem cytochrome c peroxidase n=1 Tax=Nitrosomonas ureae TaxID=44577 RepID=A0A1H2GKH4_9PROT|nr:cytochrome c peroxidase [Nitrosomonas ureae]ALQ51556.1 cytochrome-c peroxidase [Nitrosomonas ureae]SDU20085.1 Di-haem cytochrome c peroxidase [Nitrosomonas ureae]